MTTGALAGSLCGVLLFGASIRVRLAYRGAAFARFTGLSSDPPSDGLFAADAVAAAFRLNGIVRGSEGVTTECRECLALDQDRLDRPRC